MKELLKSNDIALLNKELMKLLSTLDAKALKIIDRLFELGIESKDNALIGYAYYRYSYYYYFTVQDMGLFRKNIREAIRYLLRSDDKEYLAASYSLIAYDAQDLGSLDVAYAYYMLAVRTSAELEGISLPGLIEGSAARLMIELGECETAIEQEVDAIRRVKKFTDAHFYNYNMIVSYSDLAICYFKLGNLEGLEEARQEIEAYFNASDKESQYLSMTHYHLVELYSALLKEDDELIKKYMEMLVKHWETLESQDHLSVMLEIELLCEYMLENGYTEEVARILEVSDFTKDCDNLPMVLRHIALKIEYYEKVSDTDGIRETLLSQHNIQRKQSAEAKQMIRYSMDFSDSVESITREREAAMEENIMLHRQANTDSVTGLPNRYAMTAYLQEKFYEAEEKSLNFAVGILDVDNFKLYNDTFGHQAGDECLKMIGDVLLEYNSTPEVYCTRYGGDEFVIGFFGLSNERIDEIRNEIATRIHEESQDKLLGVVDVSQGVFNRVPDSEYRLWDYLTFADKELYTIKRLRIEQ